MHWEPATLNRRTSRTAELVHIVSVELQALGNQGVEVWRRHVIDATVAEGRIVLAVIANVGPSPTASVSSLHPCKIRHLFTPGLPL